MKFDKCPAVNSYFTLTIRKQLIKPRVINNVQLDVIYNNSVRSFIPLVVKISLHCLILFSGKYELYYLWNVRRSD